MSDYEFGPKPAEQISLEVGDRYRVGTESGTIYDIEVMGENEGLLSSKVRRTSIDETGTGVNERILEQAGIIGGQTVGVIARGNYMQINGLDAETGRTVRYISSRVQNITKLEDQEPDPGEN